MIRVALPLATLGATLTSTASADTSATTTKVYAVRLNNGPVGYAICGTDATYMGFNDGTERLFVIGTDHAVWNIVEYPNGTQSGWRSLGGWLQIGVYAYIYDPRYAYDLEIWSYGRDGLAWCRALHSSWGRLAPLLNRTIKQRTGARTQLSDLRTAPDRQPSTETDNETVALPPER